MYRRKSRQNVTRNEIYISVHKQSVSHVIVKHTKHITRMIPFLIVDDCRH
jgi:hypothetical protein